VKQVSFKLEIKKAVDDENDELIGLIYGCER